LVLFLLIQSQRTEGSGCKVPGVEHTQVIKVFPEISAAAKVYRSKLHPMQQYAVSTFHNRLAVAAQLS
jgi:hypothetical protein